MAMTWTFGAACRTFSSAWEPRPPQPMTPTLMVSSPAAWTLDSMDKLAAKAALVTAVVFRKSRRVVSEEFGWRLVVIKKWSPVWLLVGHGFSCDQQLTTNN